MPVSIVWDVFKTLFPKISEAIKDGFAALHKSRRRRQHIFVLKAITQLDPGVLLPPLEYPRYDLHTINNRLKIAQYEEAIRMHDGGDINLLLPPEEEHRFAAELKKVEKEYGLPSVRDPQRAQKVERILHDMVEANKLIFYPPNTWSIRV